MIRRLVILAILFGQIAYHFSWSNVQRDPDIWWHLATGRWIVQNQTVPATDPFSAYGQHRPWVAYMWLYDLVVFQIHEHLGLAGIEYLKTSLALVFALTLYFFLLRVSRSFGMTALLTVLVLSACLPLATPRPWLVTMVLFSIELALLTRLRNDREKKMIWLLPVLFVVWANVHVQFIYGLLLIGFFLAEAIQERFQPSFDRYTGSWGSGRLYLGALALCAAAVCLNPYGARLYGTVWEIASQGNIYLLIQELSPPSFRSPTHWLFMGLLFGAAYTMGRRKTKSALPFLLLLFALVSSLRIQRDAWLAAVAGAAILAGWPSGRRPDPEEEQLWTPRLAAVGVGLASLALIPFITSVEHRELERMLSRNFPVQAVRFIGSRRLEGPIFNDFGWGGYLTWALPGRPVAMDGRTNVHTSARILESYTTWAGGPRWSSNPDLRRANLVLAPRAQALTSILRLSREYQVAYEDDVAVVFVRSASDGGRLNR